MSIWDDLFGTSAPPYFGNGIQNVPSDFEIFNYHQAQQQYCSCEACTRYRVKMQNLQQHNISGMQYYCNTCKEFFKDDINTHQHIKKVNDDITIIDAEFIVIDDKPMELK